MVAPVTVETEAEAEAEAEAGEEMEAGARVDRARAVATTVVVRAAARVVAWAACSGTSWVAGAIGVVGMDSRDPLQA